MQVMILDSTGAMGVIEGPQLDALACTPLATLHLS